MDIIQYQRLSEPVLAVPEATTVDRWLPTCPVPDRSIYYVAGTHYAAPVSTVPAASTVDRWQPTFTQPDRTPEVRQGEFAAPTEIVAGPVTPDFWGPTYPQPDRTPQVYQGAFAAPVSTAPEAVTVDRFAPTFVQPDRTPHYAAGTTEADPVYLKVEAVTADRWAPTFTQPDCTPHVYQGVFAAPLSEVPESVTVDRWLPTFVQPDRTPHYATGTTHAAPLTEVGEATSADRWLPTFVQPDRPLLSALDLITGSTIAVGPVSTAPESVTIDRFAPTFAQPDRTPHVYQGFFAIPVSESPESITIDRFGPTFVQPDRTPHYVAGTLEVGPVWLLPESVTEDRWQPTFVQPDRTPHYVAGTLEVGPVSTLPETTSVDRWLPTFAQPDRTPHTAAATTETPDLSTATIPTVDRWLPTFAQPDRTPHAARGTIETLDLAIPIVATVDAWIPTFTQPDRTPHAARGTIETLDLAIPIVATVDAWIPTFTQPDRTPHAAVGTIQTPDFGSVTITTVDRWAPTYPQPDRSARSAAATFAADVLTTATVDQWIAPAQPPVAPTVAIDTRQVYAAPVLPPAAAALDWLGIPTVPAPEVAPLTTTALVEPLPVVPQILAPTNPQPDRSPHAASGTATVEPVSTHAETVTADRWLPTLVQPDRTPTLAPGAIPAVFSPVLVPVGLDWIPARPPLPSILPPPPFGYFAAPLPVPVIGPDRWLPRFPQPDRTPGRQAVAGWFTVPASLQPENTPVEQWLPTWTQPRPAQPLFLGGSPAAGLTQPIVPPPTPPASTAGTLLGLLGGLQSQLVTAGVPGSPQAVLLSLFQQPFPTIGGPFLFITPGAYRSIDPQGSGAGRYLSGMTGTTYVTAVARNAQDIGGQSLQALTGQSGVSSLVDAAVNALQYTFPLDPAGSLLTQEPIRLVDYGIPYRYGKGGEWIAVRLGFETSWTLALTLPEDVVINPVAATPSDIAGCILAIRSILTGNGIFAPQTCMVGLQDELFPLAGSPFAIIAPGRFSPIAGQGEGAGRYLSGMQGTFTVHVVTRNMQDLADWDTQLLLNTDTSVGLLARIAAVIDQLQYSFIVDGSGNLLTEEPIRLVSIGAPKRYRESGGAREWGGVPLTWEAKFAYNVTEGI